MLSKNFVIESAANELAKKLPSLEKHDYNTIDKLMRGIAKKHHITGKALHDLFVNKYKSTPDDWIKNKLDEKKLTTESIQKTILYRNSKNPNIKNNLNEIRSVYKNIYSEYHVRPPINQVTEAVNNLLPHIYENVDPEIKDFYDQLKKLSKSSHVPIKIGAKICILQTILDMYSNTVILRGFKNPKTIVDITTENNSIKQLTFDDGTVFPEKYEFSTTELGVDLLDTFFFNSKNDLEQMLTTISLILPYSYKLGTKLLTENVNYTDNLQQEVDRFVKWTKNKLQLKTHPKIELSYDTKDAQDNHHTGSHIDGENSVWVYVKNRNLVDILRTIAHELTHVRQGELDMIKPGASYPGSPIELLADMVSGKLIKIYGAKNHHIFQ